MHRGTGSTNTRACTGRVQWQARGKAGTAVRQMLRHKACFYFIWRHCLPEAAPSPRE